MNESRPAVSHFCRGHPECGTCLRLAFFVFVLLKVLRDEELRDTFLAAQPVAPLCGSHTARRAAIRASRTVAAGAIDGTCVCLTFLSCVDTNLRRPACRSRAHNQMASQVRTHKQTGRNRFCCWPTNEWYKWRGAGQAEQGQGERTKVTERWSGYEVAVHGSEFVDMPHRK